MRSLCSLCVHPVVASFINEAWCLWYICFDRFFLVKFGNIHILCKVHRKAEKKSWTLCTFLCNMLCCFFSLQTMTNPNQFSMGCRSSFGLGKPNARNKQKICYVASGLWTWFICQALVHNISQCFPKLFCCIGCFGPQKTLQIRRQDE
jgi:hypothetical protein